MRPQITLDGSQYNNVLFSLGGRITFMNVGGYGNELRNDVIVGSEYGIRTEYYHPFRAGSNWFVAPRGLRRQQRIQRVYQQRQPRLDLSRQRGWRRRGSWLSSWPQPAKFASAMKPNMSAIPSRLAKTPSPPFQGARVLPNSSTSCCIPTILSFRPKGRFAASSTQWFDAYPSPVSLLIHYRVFR